MGTCPYGACEECQLFSTPPAECHFWSPLKKTCIMSSAYEEDEMEDVYLDHKGRARKMSDRPLKLEEFLERMKEMRGLRKGWLDGDGEEISREVLDLVEDEVRKRLSECPPHVFPMESGGLSLEWFLKEDFCATVGPSLQGDAFGREGKEFVHWKEDWTLEASWERLERMVEKLR